MNDNNLQTAHWSSYWSSGALTSLPEDFKVNYDGEIASFWSDIFNDLPNGARVLDVCCGNGPLSLLAIQNNSTFEIHGVDSANVNPKAIIHRYPNLEQSINKISFYSNTKIEDFDAENESFDIVISQYGLEYTNLEVTSKKLYQLLRPGGKLRIISHSVTSEMLEFMQSEYREYRLLIDNGFFRMVEEYDRSEVAYQSLVESIKSCFDNLNIYLEKQESRFYRSLLAGLGKLGQMNYEQFELNYNAMLGFFTQIRYGYSRLVDMLQANSLIHNEENWYKDFLNSGFELEKTGELMYASEHNVGNYFSFKKT
ncbi:MAG: class I SAM-dependent methyltransferase [Kangiellaceae bacterium]